VDALYGLLVKCKGKAGNLPFQANPVLLRIVCCGNRIG
jgi:hypothetical protein